eukprot:TRINITY_DN36686_c0_g1_i1.p1 TRINITY_DN36686_c0_g1~~TRINITY_DN36686_c0_g1_i1.p1  ORF type:complete len:765 (-),score=171.57 TRINITY_DN36686_c0_g1_i1:547-2841(-)
MVVEKEKLVETHVAVLGSHLKGSMWRAKRVQAERRRDGRRHQPEVLEESGLNDDFPELNTPLHVRPNPPAEHTPKPPPVRQLTLFNEESKNDPEGSLVTDASKTAGNVKEDSVKPRGGSKTRVGHPPAVQAFGNFVEESVAAVPRERPRSALSAPSVNGSISSFRGDGDGDWREALRSELEDLRQNLKQDISQMLENSNKGAGGRFGNLRLSGLSSMPGLDQMGQPQFESEFDCEASKVRKTGSIVDMELAKLFEADEDLREGTSRPSSAGGDKSAVRDLFASREKARKSEGATAQPSKTNARRSQKKKLKWYQQLKPSQLKKRFQESKVEFADIVDIFIAFAIIANGLVFGVQTDYMARNVTETVPDIYGYFELIFASIFTTELVMRIIRERSDFLRPGRDNFEWNVFDSILVTFQLFDVIMENAIGTGKVAIGSNLGFIRLLRILRLLRVLRLIRLFHFLGEMNVVTAAIAASLKSLVGTLIMLLILMFIVGMMFCQITTTHRVEQKDMLPAEFAKMMASDNPQDDAPLTYWWGSLSRSILTLYESILGGCDWNDIIVPLIGVNPILGILFALYIAFVILTMFNVLTGVFVESSLKLAEKLKASDFTSHIKKVTEQTAEEMGGEGMLSREDFDLCLQDPEIREYMRDLGIEMDDAAILFDFLADDGSGAIASEEVLFGLVRLRASAKFIDMLTLLHQVGKQHKKLSRIEQSLSMLTKVSKLLLLRSVATAGASPLVSQGVPDDDGEDGYKMCRLRSEASGRS